MKRFAPQIARAEAGVNDAKAQYLEALKSVASAEQSAQRSKSVADVLEVQRRRAEATRLYQLITERSRILLNYTRGVPIGNRYEERRDPVVPTPTWIDTLGPD